MDHHASDAQRYAVKNPERFSEELGRIREERARYRDDLERFSYLESRMEEASADLQVEYEEAGKKKKRFGGLAKPLAWAVGIGVAAAAGAAAVGYKKDCHEDDGVNAAYDSGFGDAVEAWMECVGEDERMYQEPPAVDERDNDGDGLPDDWERAIETDISNPDTDNDGLGDNFEYMSPSLDPLHKDMIVEEYFENETSPLGGAMKDTIIDYYANEVPLSNPDGKNGVNVHFIKGKKIDHDRGAIVKAVYKSGSPDELSSAAPSINRIKIIDRNDELDARHASLSTRHTFNHELSHLLFPHIPIQYQADNDSHHTNIPDDVLAKPYYFDVWRSAKVLWDWKEQRGDKIFPRQPVLIE